MKTNPFHISTLIVVAAVVIAQFPGVEQNFLIPFTAEHPHLLTIIEGVVGILLLWWTNRAKVVMVR